MVFNNAAAMFSNKLLGFCSYSEKKTTSNKESVKRKLVGLVEQWR